MVVRDLKDLPEVHAPIPGMKPPVTSFPYQDPGNPDEVDEFLAFIRICARSPWWFRTHRDERSAPRHGRRVHSFQTGTRAQPEVRRGRSGAPPPDLVYDPRGVAVLATRQQVGTQPIS